MRKQIIFAIFSLATLSIHADEGMWMLTDLQAQNAAVMRELGLEIPIEEVYSPNGIALKDAVVHFGGGCTGEVISAEGLVLTNHHCGYGAIQQHSSVEHDYLTNGFWAMNRNEELPCKGLTVTFIDRILDVTPYVNEQLKTDEDPDGTNYLSPKYLEKVAKRFAKAENIEVTPATKLELKAFYGGNRYYLFVKTVYSDIRMVGAPPSSIGKFGADTDNWMWPRHTGDFSLFRIYADKDGNPSEYSKENIPLKVKKHLTISLAGIQEGDFTFVMGFPGRNWRYMISDEVEERMQTTNFMRHHVRGARQEVLMEQMLKDPAVRIHYASKYASSANYWKNAIGMNEGLVRLKVLDTKRAQQEQLLARGREKGDDSYQKAFDEILGFIRPGVTEREIALKLDNCMLENGAEGLSFETIALAGANTSMPHGVPGNYKVKNGDFVLMDFGAVYDGYHSDMTRTVCVGQSSEKMGKIYDIVLKAQLEALKKVKSGITGSELDGYARDIIDESGYGDFFGHSLGHGVGMEIHEFPTASSKSETILKENMVVTVEPGIYLPGEFGVRIEDFVVVTENSHQNLTNCPKKLIIL